MQNFPLTLCSVYSSPPVSLAMALSPARYGPGLLNAPVATPTVLTRPPTPKHDASDNDGK